MKEGKVSHFFHEDDLTNHFKDTEIMETGTFEAVFEYSNRENLLAAIANML